MAKESNGKSGSAACGCGRASEGSAHPDHAAGVDPGLKEANLKQLRRIEGQIRGIAAMIQDDRYCADIINQVSAARESLHSVARNLMRNHLMNCAARAMQEEGGERDRMVEELLDLVSKIAR